MTRKGLTRLLIGGGLLLWGALEWISAETIKHAVFETVVEKLSAVTGLGASTLIALVASHAGPVLLAAAAVAILYYASIQRTDRDSISVACEWETTIDRGRGRGPERHEDVLLQQRGRKVRGEATARDGQRYDVDGTITGEKLCMVYRVKDNQRWDAGAILLNISPDRGTMRGFEIGINQDDNSVYSYPYTWTRKP
jgi:hypothetical protein